MRRERTKPPCEGDNRLWGKMTITKTKDNKRISSGENLLYIHTFSRGRRWRQLIVYTYSCISGGKFCSGKIIASFLVGSVGGKLV